MPKFILRLLPFLLVFASVACAAPTLVLVSQTIYRGDGTPAKGSVYISWQSFDTAAGDHVQGGTLTKVLTSSGLLSVQLAPNLGAVPSGTAYTVKYSLDLGSPETVTWVVPASGPVTVTAIQSTTLIGPSSIVALTQLSLGGATNGQCLVANTSLGLWAPGSCGIANPLFSSLATGTNTTATMTVGTGASITVSGSGINNANQFNGATAPTSATVVATNSSAQLIAATVQGNGAKVQLSTGSTTTNDCVKFDANGNTVDAGNACASPAFSALTSGTNTNTLTIGTAGVLSFSGTGLINANLVNGQSLPSSASLLKTDFFGVINAATVPTSSKVVGTDSGGNIITVSLQGNGAKVQLSTGTTTTNDCVKFDANGNTVDAGAACGSGGSGSWKAPTVLASLPGTCTVGDTYYVSDANVSAGGSYFYSCPVTNTFVQFGYTAGPSGAISVSGTNGANQIDVTSAVLLTTGTFSPLGSYDFSGATSFIPKAVVTSAGTSVTLSQTNQYFVCTSTCTVTVPVPAAGKATQYCVYNDNNVATVITLAAIGSSARYEYADHTAYGTAGTGTFVSGGAVGDAVCIVARDATHYSTRSSSGLWTAN